jgi:hypothetical protein
MQVVAAFLRPLEVVLVEPGAPEGNNFVCHLAQRHYLGFDGASGQRQIPHRGPKDRPERAQPS